MPRHSLHDESLMRGDEAGLGSPMEDAASMVASACAGRSDAVRVVS